MKAISMSKFGLFCLPLKHHNLFKTCWCKNHFLFGCGYYSEPQITKKCHFSQTSHYPATVLFLKRSQNLDSLHLRHSAYSHLYTSLLPSSIPQWRHFNNNRPQNTNKQSQEKVDKKGREDTEFQTKNEVVDGVESDIEPVKKLTLYERFKKTYKEHGKVLVAVHLLTSAVWFGTFYTVARCGVDVVPLMESLNFSERIISPFRSGSLGNIAVAYLMYKLATPVRYTVTIGGTNLTIKYLRKEGKIPHVSQEDTLRSLYKEGKESFKRRSHIHFRRLRRKHKIKLRVTHTREKH